MNLDRFVNKICCSKQNKKQNLIASIDQVASQNQYIQTSVDQVLQVPGGTGAARFSHEHTNIDCNSTHSIDMEPSISNTSGTRAASVGPSTNPADLSQRDKRHLASVEKVVASFDSLDEWADYIAFLSRLKKALALPAEKNHSLSWIPLAAAVSAKLSLCLSPALPNGVHQKALELYACIFNGLTVEELNASISVWLPGLLPLLSYGSMQVKPQLIQLYSKTLLRHLEPPTLKSIAKPIVLCLLAGLDDENSESFNDVLQLLETFKERLNNNPVFWQTFFLCMITSPEKRIGALNWASANLPSFNTIDTGSEKKFSAEAQACLSPEPGLMVRAFAAALNTKSEFNQATDVLVIRGFFDLLLSRVPLHSPMISEAISPADKEFLLMSCCRVTLKKDMSLNRRLWNWLLGPEADESSQNRKNYFEKHAMPAITHGLITLISSGEKASRLEACKIALALIMDKWEISSSMTAQVFVPILECCKEHSSDKATNDLMVATKSFFDEVETCYIWDYIICTLILSGSKESLSMLEFLFKNFNFPEDERIAHIPFALLAFLLNYDITDESMAVLDLLVDLSSPGLYPTIVTETKSTFGSDDMILEELKNHYSDLSAISSEQQAIDGPEMSLLVMKSIQNWYISTIKSNKYSDRIAEILSEFLDTVPRQADVNPLGDSGLKNVVLEYPEFSWSDNYQETENAATIFGMARVCRHAIIFASQKEKSKILKVIFSNLWSILISRYPANHQVEAVRCIFDLQNSFDFHAIEAGLLYMLLESPEDIRLHTFYKIWTHSADLSGAENMLSNSLFVILDGLHTEGGSAKVEVPKFIYKVITDGSASRLLRIITDPLLTFPLLEKDAEVISGHEDLQLFAYYLESVLSVVESNEKALKDSLNHEFVSSESKEKMDLITSNGWDISNYKSLLLCIIQKFFALKVSVELTENEQALLNFRKCVFTALELYSHLITGSESDFESRFKSLIDTTFYYIQHEETKSHELEVVTSMYIKTILEFMAMAKSMNINLMHLVDPKSPEIPLLISFIIEGLKSCSSSTLLEHWTQVLNESLYLLNDSIFHVTQVLNMVLIKKIDNLFKQIRAFEKSPECSNLETFVSICLSTLEDLLSISHSYLVTSNMRSVSKTPQNENGFLGNYLSGVFQIESPAVKSEAEQRIYSVVSAFQDTTSTAFDIWCWADGKPTETHTSQYASSKSIIHLSNKLKFRSRKLLERLAELERQEVIETIIASKYPAQTKIKITHVLDNGRSQLSLPKILDSILTRCAPHVLSEKERSTMYSHVTVSQLAEFLAPYYESIDHDSVSDVWEKSLSFFKEVSSHPSQFKNQLLNYLKAIKMLLVKATHAKHGGAKRSGKDLANYFQAILNALVSSKISSQDKPTDDQPPRLSVAEQILPLIPDFGEIFNDSDKLNSAVTTIISALVTPQMKPRVKHIDPHVVDLIEVIGQNHPLKSWKQLVSDVFSDNAFFNSDKFQHKGWRNIIALWITNDKEKMTDYVSRVTPSFQASAANIFVWNESSEVEDRIYVLKKIAYSLMVQPKDTFGSILSDLFARLTAALNNTCPALYKSEALVVFRALTLKVSEAHLMPYWAFMIQTLESVFVDSIKMSPKNFSGLDSDNLQLLLSACKLLDSLLLVGYDEFNLITWLFVSNGFVSDAPESSDCLIDSLARLTEGLVHKDHALAVERPTRDGKTKPLLYGVSRVKSIAQLKMFFGSLSYINFERSYGLCVADLEACEEDVHHDLCS